MKTKLCVGLLLGVFFSLNQPANAIFNGQSVSDDDPIRPVTVSVYSEVVDCTGVKIASNLILAAKHCELNESTRVIFSDGSSYKIVHVFMPIQKRTSDENEYDFAILEIEGHVPGPVAEIADNSATPKNGSAGWVAGYGGRRVTKTNNPLRKIQVRMTDRDYSPSAVSVRISKGGAVCDGDLGGPGYTQRHRRIVVWGIDSAPFDGQSTCSSHEVFAKVASEYDWIRKIIAGARLNDHSKQRP